MSSLALSSTPLMMLGLLGLLGVVYHHRYRFRTRNLTPLTLPVTAHTTSRPAFRPIPVNVRRIVRTQAQTPVLTWIELTTIIAWAMWVGRAFLDFDPTTLPVGYWNEWGMAIQPHYIWSTLSTCGGCVFWNGAINGGNPAFIDLHGAQLHPLVILTTLIWGATVGAKVAVVGSLTIAGIAQWWLARVLKLGFIPRLWSALLVVTGGHLLGRLEHGVFAVVLSTASCSLILPPALDLALNKERRSAVLLGIVVALAIVSGQGYLQVGAVFGFGPALLLLLLNRDGSLRRVWKEFMLAGTIALLLAGIFLVPLAHFWPNFAKDVDPTFASAQPLGWTPLNLVINDASFYRGDHLLDKQPYPYLYITYISWVPIAFALLAVRLVPQRHSRLLLFFGVAVVGLYLMSSAVTLRLLAPVMPTFATGIRNPSLIAGLAVPLVVGLGAYGLDLLLKRGWPTMHVDLGWTVGGVRTMHLRPMGALLLLPLGWSVLSAYSFNQQWLTLKPRDAAIPDVVAALAPETTAWVEPVYGVHAWTPATLDAGLKATTIVRPWHWAGRDRPEPAARATVYADVLREPGYQQTIGTYHIVKTPEHAYAFVDTGSRHVPCLAHAVGGNIDVICDTDQPGRLVIREHLWDGWSGTIDGVPVALGTDQWITAEAPAGTHTYSFRYRPWDVWLGLACSVGGMVLASWGWWNGRTRTTCSLSA